MQTTFNVSNTDVITMLVVKQEKILTERRLELITKLATEIDNFNKEIKKRYESQLAKINNIAIESYKNLIQLRNPKKKFTVQIGQIPEYFKNNWYVKNKFEYSTDFIYLDADFGDYEDFHCITEGENRLFIPCKIKISLEIPSNLLEYEKQLNEIDNLLRNKEELKNQMVAKLTEQAIKNIPELNMLVQNDTLLAIGN